MLFKKPLILALAIAFSLHCLNGQTQENNQPTRIMLLPDESEESEAIEWWELKQESDENHSDMPQVYFGDDILLKPGTGYCFSPDPGVNAESYRRAASDDSADSEDSDSEDSDSEDSDSEDSDSEDSGGSDKNSDNRSNEDEADAESHVEYLTTTLNPFRVPNKISQYCATLELKKIKQEPVSDGETPTDSEVKVTEVDSVNHPKITPTAYSTDQASHLKTHKQTLLPVDRRPRIQQCDHEGCGYSSYYRGHLKRHKQTHLPADQRLRKPKVHQCDHEGCNFRTHYLGLLKTHKRTHLPADQRPKLHQCDHEGCYYSSPNIGNVKRHKQTHLPADQRPKVHQCDHEGCDYRTDHRSSLKTHKRIHLLADQRPKVHQCDHEGCNYRTDRAGNVKRHKQTHLTADQRSKRKAYDQPLSDKKRKKDDKE
ncbi:hypothetical protein [Endozoicomonas sp. 4G]|uniref:hypothetical protein n=1 Tax=Endozoicomonas sp. 4G TaxID=2872754 RepID=UPI0020791095|nr:hypothetical protein [Endozoicomonas sp. 4G]